MDNRTFFANKDLSDKGLPFAIAGYPLCCPIYIVTLEIVAMAKVLKGISWGSSIFSINSDS
jgi:hypothetical protein